MEQVTLHLTGTAEEVREALLVLAGGPIVQQLPTSVGVPTPVESEAVQGTQSIISPPDDTLISHRDGMLHKGPYSDTLCARKDCHNKLTVKQVRQRSKYCSMSCAGMARRGVARPKAAPQRTTPTDAEVTIVAGEGVVKGSVMSEESASRP